MEDSKLAWRKFIIKLTNWEYWPFGVIQLPVFLYWLWLSLKSRSLVFFTASNPGILTGGMFGESKHTILKKIPESFRPRSVLITAPTSPEYLEAAIQQGGLSFPLIFKPDLGERGWKVKRINNLAEAQLYLSEINIDFIIQEFVDLPLEFGVFYCRLPDAPSGFVTSIVQKEMLTITGNGSSTMRELIMQSPRAILQWEILRSRYATRLDERVPEGEQVELVSIGNHCLGTKFLNANHLITEKLADAFDRLSQTIPGFYYGRFDLRVASTTDLEVGSVKIMELNGCGAEPAHIYHPGTSLWYAVSEMLRHWRYLYLISKQNHRRGVKYMSFREAYAIFKKFRSTVGD